MKSDQARQNWLAIAEKLGHDRAKLEKTGEASGEVVLRQLGPTPVMAISLEDKTIPADTDWNLGTSTTPVVINLNTLTMEPGSSISIYNTALTLTVQTLIRK